MSPPPNCNPQMLPSSPSHVQTDESEVITFLLTTEIIPLCLRIMESGSELSKTVATFIVQKILVDDLGLQYICHTYERFSHVASVLVSRLDDGVRCTMLERAVLTFAASLFCVWFPSSGKNGIGAGQIAVIAPAEARHPLLPPSVREPSCARCAATVPARCAARQHLCGVPEGGKALDNLGKCSLHHPPSPLDTVALQDDTTTKRWLAQLLHNISDTSTVGQDPGASVGFKKKKKSAVRQGCLRDF